MDIGYHYVITNCYPTYDAWIRHRPLLETDGQIWPGRDVDRDGDVDEEIGAHAFGYNSRSLGICLVGQHGSYTSRQIYMAVSLMNRLARHYKVRRANVIGHAETGNTPKTCPVLDMAWFRGMLHDDSDDKEEAA